MKQNSTNNESEDNTLGWHVGSVLWESFLFVLFVALTVFFVFQITHWKPNPKHTPEIQARSKTAVKVMTVFLVVVDLAQGVKLIQSIKKKS